MLKPYNRGATATHTPKITRKIHHACQSHSSPKTTQIDEHNPHINSYTTPWTCRLVWLRVDALGRDGSRSTTMQAQA